MKKMVLALLMGLCFIGMYGQADPVVRSVRFEAQSEAEMNALPANKLQEGSVCYREDTDSLWRYNGSTWAEISGSSGSGHIVQDEGSPLTARANINFVGAGVTATDDSGNDATVVTIPGTQISVTTTSGWGDYVDTQYTSGSPLSLSADTDTQLPNNRGTIVDSEKPSDITEFVNSSGLIVGNEGDAYVLTIEYKIVPTDPGTTYVETWIDIGGAVGELYRRIVSFPKGNGVERTVTFSTGVYTLNTWEANSGTPYIRANGTANVYDIRFIVYRLHKSGNEYVQSNSITSDMLAGIINGNSPTTSEPFLTENDISATVQPYNANTDTDSTDDATLAGNNVYTGTQSFTNDISTTGASDINFQNSDILLSGDLLEANKNTIVTSGSDPTGQASILFNPNGTLFALTATPTDITYNGNSLTASGSGDLWSDVVDSDILVDTDATYDLGNATSQFNISHFERYTTPNVSNDAWWIMDGSSGDHFGLDYSATPSTAFSPLYTFHNTGTPTNSTDVATKAYVDANSGSSDYFLKETVRTATTANITLSGDQTVDGNNLNNGERILVKDQTDQTENGIYIVNTSGAWSRAADNDTKEDVARTLVYVRAGSTNFDKFFQTDFDNVDVLDTNNVVFTEVDLYGSGSGDVTAASNFGTDNVLIRADGTGKGVQSSGITISDTDLVTFPGGTYYSAGNMNLGDSRFYMGEDEGVSGRRWSVEKSQATEKYVFSYQQSDQTTSTGGTYTAFYTLDESGTPSGSTDLIPKSYADANYDDQTAAEVTSSATGNIAATNVDDAIAELESEKLASISASRTNEETYSNVIGQPYDDSVSDGAPPAGTLILEYEVPPAILGTGTTADMDDYMGYNTGTAGSGTSYTIQNVVEGGFSYFYVNAASEPTVSGTGITVEKFPNTTAFINNEDMYMCVWAVTDTLVHYWFVEKQ